MYGDVWRPPAKSRALEPVRCSENSMWATVKFHVFVHLFVHFAPKSLEDFRMNAAEEKLKYADGPLIVGFRIVGLGQNLNFSGLKSKIQIRISEGPRLGPN
jgi:hypothetical protein